MRSWGVLTGMMLLLAACGATEESATSTAVLTTAVAASSTPMVESTTTTAEPIDATTPTNPPTTARPPSTTSTVTPSDVWSVAHQGRNPRQELGETGALGSGCSPGAGDLPDGVWFGWIEAAEPGSIDFDLACLWPGRLEPAAGNDASVIRTVTVAASTLVYTGPGDPVTYSAWSGDLTPADNAPGLPESLPFWLYVNDGQATELAEYPEPILWARSRTVWPDLIPGCCDGGDVAPPSPDGSLPETGWPEDGFYKAYPMRDGDYAYDWPLAHADGTYGLLITKFLDCDDYPDLCPDYWVGNEVTVDPNAPLLQRFAALDEHLTVVIVPITNEPVIVGDGIAFDGLLTDINQAVASRPISDDQAEDPASAFGYMPAGTAGGGEFGYRGPGGTYLTWFGGWMALEIRDGSPILYIHAGLTAG
jgi:hypothetical protein